MNNSKPIAAGTTENENVYDSPKLVVIGNATEVVLGVSDLSGDDYFGFSRAEFGFQPDGDDSDTR